MKDLRDKVLGATVLFVFCGAVVAGLMYGLMANGLLSWVILYASWWALLESHVVYTSAMGAIKGERPWTKQPKNPKRSHE